MTRPFLPITTQRLTIRSMGEDDAAALHVYRNQPHVGYQDWELPYPLEKARRLVEESSAFGGPTRCGAWVQMAIEFEGRLAGDVAVGLDADGEIASLGYTLREDMQGRGIAREAVRAVVERLFTVTGVHRIEATVDPRNLPSIRLLEAIGFQPEGVAREACKVRGEWTDDARYGLLASDSRR